MGLRLARTTVDSHNITFRDNIVYYDDYRWVEMGRDTAGNWLGDLPTLDYNLYYYDTTTNVITWNGTNHYATLAAFVSATSQETHGAQSDPLFVDAANGDFHLQAGSPALTMSSTGSYVGALPQG